SGRDDGSRGTTRHEIAFVGQHLIGHFDCATRQRQLTGEVAHGRHAVSRTEFASSNRLPIAPIQLQIERHALFLARSEVLQVHIECPIKLVNSCTYLLGHDFPTVLSMQQGSSPEENYMSTPKRLPYYTLSPEAYRGLGATKAALEKSSLGMELIQLVWLRMSQINGCAFCLEMHAQALRADNVPGAKIDSLAGWRVSDRFS